MPGEGNDDYDVLAEWRRSVRDFSVAGRARARPGLDIERTPGPPASLRFWGPAWCATRTRASLVETMPSRRSWA